MMVLVMLTVMENKRKKKKTNHHQSLLLEARNFKNVDSNASAKSTVQASPKNSYLCD